MPFQSSPSPGRACRDDLSAAETHGEHPVEYALGFLEPAQPPEAQAESIHAAQKRPIVNPAPRQHSCESFPQRQATDPRPNFLVTDRVFRLRALEVAAVLLVIGFCLIGSSNGSSGSSPDSTCSISNAGRGYLTAQRHCQTTDAKRATQNRAGFGSRGQQAPLLLAHHEHQEGSTAFTEMSIMSTEKEDMRVWRESSPF
jgi:hypothetical protein